MNAQRSDEAIFRRAQAAAARWALRRAMAAGGEIDAAEEARAEEYARGLAQAFWADDAYDRPMRDMFAEPSP